MILRLIGAIAATAAESYLLGSICFGIIFTRIFEKKDVRTMGSGNAGMTNVLRSAGTLPGALTGIGDFSKGIAALVLGSWLFEWVALSGYAGSCLAAAGVLAGHLFPVFFGFKGGKGVMTSGGILLVLNPYILLVEAVIFAITFFFSRIISMASIACAVALPLVNYIICRLSDTEPILSTVFMACMSALVIFTHRGNIKRILNGTEAKLVIKKKKL